MDFFTIGELLTITPAHIIITDDSATTYEYLTSSTARFQIDPLLGNQTFYESVSLNYPNPFHNETVLFFSIKEPTTLQIKLCNFLGTVIQKIPNNSPEDNYLHYTIYNSNNEEVAGMFTD